MAYETSRTLLFYLDTRLRSGGTKGNPDFTFPNNLINIKPQDGEFMRLTMQEASLEYTFYQTETYNNKLLVVETQAGQPTITRPVSIAPGNYNIASFLVELTRFLNLGSPYYIYVLTYIAPTNSIRYRATAKPGFSVDTITFIFDPIIAEGLFPISLEESLNAMMGFQINDVVTFSVNIGFNILELNSNTPITMSPGVTNLYITVQNSCSNFGNANVANVFSSSNVLAKIPVSSPPFSTLFFFDVDANFATIINNKYIDNLNLTLFNERFTKIEPRKDWSFTIKIDILRSAQQNKTSNLLKELVDMTKMKLLKKETDKKKTTKKKDSAQPTSTPDKSSENAQEIKSTE